MTAKKLQTYVGRTCWWTPPSRAQGATIRVKVIVVNVKQRYGRDELLIEPIYGDGNAWVAVESLTILRP